MATVVYSCGIKVPHDCPRTLTFDLPSLGLSATLSVPDQGSRLELTIAAPNVADDWIGDEQLLRAVDAEARRVFAALSFRYMVPFNAPLRERPKNYQAFDVTLCIGENPDGREREELELPQVLATDNPESHPLWQVFASAGAATDPISKFVSLWGLLDIGLEAERADEIDGYLVGRFGVPHEFPDRNGNPNRETRFANLRHAISHPSGRGVDSIRSLSGKAEALLPELTEMCRVGVREEFKT